MREPHVRYPWRGFLARGAKFRLKSEHDAYDQWSEHVMSANSPKRGLTQRKKANHWIQIRRVGIDWLVSEKQVDRGMPRFPRGRGVLAGRSRFSSGILLTQAPAWRFSSEGSKSLFGQGCRLEKPPLVCLAWPSCRPIRWAEWLFSASLDDPASFSYIIALIFLFFLSFCCFSLPYRYRWILVGIILRGLC